MASLSCVCRVMLQHISYNVLSMTSVLTNQMHHISRYHFSFNKVTRAVGSRVARRKHCTALARYLPAQACPPSERWRNKPELRSYACIRRLHQCRVSSSSAEVLQGLLLVQRQPSTAAQPLRYNRTPLGNQQARAVSTSTQCSGHIASGLGSHHHSTQSVCTCDTIHIWHQTRDIAPAAGRLAMVLVHTCACVRACVRACVGSECSAMAKFARKV